MKIISISTITTGRDHFKCQKALVKIETGQEYVYRFEFCNTWVDMNDYLDNVKSDFENEYNSDDNDFGEEEFGLFLKFYKREIWEAD